MGNQGVPHRNPFSPCWRNVLTLPSLYGSSSCTLQTSLAPPLSLPSVFLVLLWQRSIRPSLLPPISLRPLPSWNQLLNICYATALFMRVSGYVREHVRVRQTSVSIFQQVACRTSASSRVSSRLGRQPKSCQRLSCRQTLLLVLTVFRSRCSRAIGRLSLLSTKTSTGSIFQTRNYQLSLCLRISRNALLMVPSRQNLLSHVVSLFEEEQQDARKPDPTRQYNLQLDSKLTITTKRRHLSSEPTDEKGLRFKYSIMTNLWLLAQMRQPGRSIYADLDRNTFIDFLEVLLDKDNFNFYKEVDGRPMISPCWSYCLSYELELRKEAIRLCKEQSFGIQSALWTALRNTEHRMKHWLQLVAIPNAPSSSSNQELQSLKKRIADLEKARSRSPRRNAQKQLALPGGPQMMALPAPSAPPQGQKGNKRGIKRRGGAGRVSGKGQATKDFDFIMKLPLEFRANFHEKFHKNEICYNFQKNRCNRTDGKCKFSHVCVGCGGSKPYDDCKMPHFENPLNLIIGFH